MKALLIDGGKVDRIIEQVTHFDGKNLEAADGSGARGIGHMVIIVEDSVKLQPSDSIDPTTLVDVRDRLPKTESQLQQEQIDEVTLVLADMFMANDEKQAQIDELTLALADIYGGVL